MNEKQTNTKTVKSLLNLAHKSINQGDISGVLESLAASGFLSGVKFRLQKKRGDNVLSFEIDECVAKAIDEACNAATSGHSIRNLSSWLWKTADYATRSIWKNEYGKRKKLPEDTQITATNEYETQE
ncbi:MAG: hypothetical protein OXC62_13680 [Aestuariivita sp.]|nr:hypothetical protein [Aestuariivita sp.]